MWILIYQIILPFVMLAADCAIVALGTELAIRRLR